MDGSAIAFGIATSPGPDWLKELVPTLGLRLKLHNDLKALIHSEQVSMHFFTIYNKEGIYWQVVSCLKYCCDSFPTNI